MILFAANNYNISDAYLNNIFKNNLNKPLKLYNFNGRLFKYGYVFTEKIINNQ